VLEGIDRSGKSTLRNEIDRLSNDRLITIDRMTVSYRVYDRFFGRPGVVQRAGFLRFMERELAWSLGLVIIFVDTSPTECYRRSVEEGNPRYTVAELSEQRRLFLEELPHGAVTVFIVRPEGRSLHDVAEECVRWVQTLT